MEKLFIEDLDLKSKRVIVRVDFNVPLNNGTVENDKRLRASLPTIQFLQKQGARVILMSHLGRPKGKIVDSMRMKPVAKALGNLLETEVKYTKDCIGSEVLHAVEDLADGQVLLLENLRFYAAEENNSEIFAKQLAAAAEIYVNDAFGTAHRAHASTAGITKYMDQSAAGYLLNEELKYLGSSLVTPERPFVAIMGGAKVSSKIGVIEALLDRVDKLILGGAMTHTFLKAQGKSIGKSVFEVDKVDLAARILEKGGDKIILPEDYLISDKFDFKTRKIGNLRAVSSAGIPEGFYALDIGPKSSQAFKEIVLGAKTVVWNGPMGVFEIDETAKGTFEVADALAQATKKGAITVIGGGDSAAAIEKAGLADQVSHVSTGGGASLKFMEGKVLPGVDSLTDKVLKRRRDD